MVFSEFIKTGLRSLCYQMIQQSFKLLVYWIFFFLSVLELLTSHDSVPIQCLSRLGVNADNACSKTRTFL